MSKASVVPHEDALLRFVVTQASLQAKGIHKTQLDRQEQGDSADHLHNLVEQGFLRRTGSGEFLPTVHGQLCMPEFSHFVTAGLAGVVAYGRGVLNNETPDKTVEAERLAQAVKHTMMLPLEDPAIRFWFDCSLFGLDPYATVTNMAADGRPRSVFFGPSLWSVGGVDDLLAKIEADRRAAIERPAQPMIPRNKEHKTPTVNYIEVYGPLGTLQTGDKSTAHVVHTIGVGTAEALAFIDAIRAAIPVEQQDVRAALEQVSGEIKSPAPDPTRIRTSVDRLWRLATDVSTIAPFVLQLARMLGMTGIP